ncbi:MAG: hypothetical protein COA78_20345 [Blastopirellula sp.]|nr:MAG: hypothetical protein COA78_20345 [Blastopirellula sp.]
MGFWTGFAEAVKAEDERDFTREMFMEKSLETRRNALLGSLQSRRGTSTKASESAGFLTALRERWPNLSPEVYMGLAADPTAAEATFKALTAKSTEYSNAGQEFTNDMAGLFVESVVTTRTEEGTITPERISELASIYDVSEDYVEEIVGGLGTAPVTASSIPIFNPSAAPTPMSYAEIAAVQEEVKGKLAARLSYESRTLREQAADVRGEDPNRAVELTRESLKVDSLLKETEDGLFDEALKSVYGAEVIAGVIKRDSRIASANIFPDIAQPVQIEEVQRVEVEQPNTTFFENEDQASAALANGNIKVGDWIVIGGRTAQVKDDSVQPEEDDERKSLVDMWKAFTQWEPSDDSVIPTTEELRDMFSLTPDAIKRRRDSNG